MTNNMGSGRARSEIFETVVVNLSMKYYRGNNRARTKKSQNSNNYFKTETLSYVF